MAPKKGAFRPTGTSAAALVAFSPDQSLIDEFLVKIQEKFDIRDLGRPDNFIGIQIKYHDKDISLVQTNMIERCLRRYNHTPAIRRTPMDSDLVLTREDHADTKPDHTEFRSICGSLNYIAQTTRPDISFSMRALMQHVANPSHAHLKQAYRVLSYLAHTRTDGLTYRGDPTTEVQGYSDADWAGDPDTRRSTSGRVFIRHGAAIMWNSKQQRGVALSTAEAEYVALTEAGRDAIWLRKLYADLGLTQKHSTLLHEDNASAIKWTGDATKWARTKHIDIAHHAIRDWREAGRLRIAYCPTGDMLADLMTKPLPQATHTRLTQLCLGKPLVSQRNLPKAVFHKSSMGRRARKT